MREFIRLVTDASWRDLMFLLDKEALFETAKVFLDDGSVYLPHEHMIP